MRLLCSSIAIIFIATASTVAHAQNQSKGTKYTCAGWNCETRIPMRCFRLINERGWNSRDGRFLRVRAARALHRTGQC